jgi:regulator of replication initiation timing
VKPFNKNSIAMKIMNLVLELNSAREEMERLKRENIELINEIRVLKLKDIVRREHGNKSPFVKQYTIEGAVK